MDEGKRMWRVRLGICLSVVVWQAVGLSHAGDVEALDLTRALEQALAMGARVTGEAARRDAAAVRADWRASAYVPQVDLMVSGTSSQYPRTVTSIREQGVFPQLDTEIFEVVPQVRWTIWDFGQDQARRGALLSRVQGAEVAYDLARLETIERVSALFLRLALLGEQEQVQTAYREQLQKQDLEIRLLLEEGRVAAVDPMRMAEMLSELEVQIWALQQEQRYARHLLAVELQCEALPPIRLPVWQGVEDDLQPDAMLQQEGVAPHVALAHAKLEASRQAYESSRRMYRPTVQLFGEHRTRMGGADWEDDNEWIAGVVVHMPLYRSQLGVTRQAAGHEMRQAQIDADHAWLALDAEEARLQDQLVLAGERQRSVATRIAYLEAVADAEQATYAEGRSKLTDWLSMHNRLQVARVAQLDVGAEQRLLRLRLAALAGTLTPELAVQLMEGNDENK